MPLKHMELRRFSGLALILVLLILAFLVIKPIILSIVTGLILAYAFNPIYLKVKKIIREKNTAALTVGLAASLIIFIPLWFLIPLLIQQIFNAFNTLQALDVGGFVRKVVPVSNVQLQSDITNAIINFISQVTSVSLSALKDFLFNIPTLLLHLSVVIFVFFFALRDQDKLKEFISEISPIKKEKQKILVKQFKDMTSSIVFGYIVVGVIQGIATGIGLLLFGVPTPLLLTIFAIFAAVIPLVGPWLIWVPAAIYLLYNSTTTAAILFALYNGIFVSFIDNVLRPYIVAKRTHTSSVIVLVGMIGGLFVFGILGIILGPLILSYVLLLIEAYKNRTLSDMFHSE